jgi:hypothetical protein
VNAASKPDCRQRQAFVMKVIGKNAGEITNCNNSRVMRQLSSSHTMEHDYDNGDLRERIYDAIAAGGQDSLRIAYEQPRPESGATFSVKFVLAIDEPTRLALHAEHKRRDISVPMLVRRYVQECFRECLADEEIAEPELNAAA